MQNNSEFGKKFVFLPFKFALMCICIKMADDPGIFC